MNINNLIENVRAFFTEQYKGVEKSGSFICFEPLGSMIDPEDFQAENEALSEIKATEQLSILGDRLPQIQEVFFADTSRLSSVYEEMVESAVFSGERISAEDKTKYIAHFAEVKSSSLQKLEGGKKASINMPEGSYLPVYGFPKKWYEKESPFWVNKTFSAKEDPPPAAEPAPKLPKQTFMGWRSKVLVNPALFEAIKQTQTEEPGTSQKIEVKTIRPVLYQAFRPLNISPRPPIRLFENQKQFAARPSAIPIRIPGRSGPTIEKSGTSQEFNVRDHRDIRHLNLRNIALADRVKIAGEVSHNNPVEVTPVHSNEFSMSFDYCIVYLERPWFDKSLFHYSNMWYSLSLGSNYFSTGAKDETNNGVMKCVPTAMILIKDLRIKAAWTDDDKSNAATSAALGIFNLNESTFTNNELVTPGMQIIGWMCEVIPQLPLLGDPNIS